MLPNRLVFLPTFYFTQTKKIERGVISASYNDMILFSEFFGVTLDYLIIGKRQDVDALKKKVQDAITQLQEALM